MTRQICAAQENKQLLFNIFLYIYAAYNSKLLNFTHKNFHLAYYSFSFGIVQNLNC